jgi:hypothetical protein
MLASQVVLARDPYIGISQQDEIARILNDKKHSAFAIGENNFGYSVFGEPTARAAEEKALEKCNAYVDRQLGRKQSKTCKLVTLNSKVLWKLPPPIGQGELSLPDVPLEKAIVTGDPAKSDAIVLILHGCDGIELELPNWMISWQRYFSARNMATIAPRSFLPPTCGPYTQYADLIFRKRVLQTKRTMKVLRSRYPGKPIIIWGHSAGSFVAQLYDFEPDKLILSGDNCATNRISVNSKTLFIFGENDQYSDFRQGKSKITAALIRKACPHYREYKNNQIVVVKGADHFTAIWHQTVIDAVSKLIGTKSYDLSEEKWTGLLTFRLKEVKQLYDSGSKHRAMAIRQQRALLHQAGVTSATPSSGRLLNANVVAHLPPTIQAPNMPVKLLSQNNPGG